MFKYSLWLDLPLSTRSKIASTFGIIKKGSTEVFNNTIKSDGYVLKEIEAIMSYENLANFFNAKDKDYSTLWTYVVDLAEGRVPHVDTPKDAPVQPLPTEIADKPKRGRPSKKING